MTSSFLWHDYETFGTDPRRDRPAQFAAVRTDENLNEIDEPMVCYCRPADDVLPQPMACLLTGITPQLARERGLPENEFTARIHEQMSRAGTCSVGYNNFRFDDELTRFLFWRNFFDPYAREYQHANSRFDLIDLMRMTRALRPAGLHWPQREDGLPGFRLEQLAAANGFDTSDAHDALADVRATVHLARLLRAGQPKLWSWALSLRQRERVKRLLESGQPLVHSSSRFPAQFCATSVVWPLCPHPAYSSQWIVWNLRVGPGPFMDLSVDELEDLLYSAEADLPAGRVRLPIKTVRTNRCPMLAPLAVLDEPARQRIEIDPDRIEAHRAELIKAVQLVERIGKLFRRSVETGSRASADAELALYDGFVPRADQALFEQVRALDGDGLARLGTPFSDPRLNQLLFRYRARLFAHTLAETERRQWQAMRRRRLLDDPELASIRLPDFRAQVLELMANHPDRREPLLALADWADQLEQSLLS